MTARSRYAIATDQGWLSGLCSAAALTPEPTNNHGLCQREYVTPTKTLRCTCGCHLPVAEEVAPATRSAGEPMLEAVPDAPAPRSPGLTITEPGLVYDMDDETYHGDPVPAGSLSSSFARRLTEHVPAKAYAAHHNRKPTASMNLGKAAHLHALGAGPEMVVWEHDGRTKAGMAERAERANDIAAERIVAVTASDRDQVQGMVEALRADSEVAAMLTSGKPEVSAFWREQGIWCRARFDLLGPIPYDYKTTDDASARGFVRAMATYGYHQQAEFYLRGLRALGHAAGSQPMRFICQEKTAPYLVQVHTCDELAMEIAAALNDRAIEIYAEAKRSGKWHGYPSLHAEPTGLPNSYFYRYADLLPDHLNPFADPEMSV